MHFLVHKLLGWVLSNMNLDTDEYTALQKYISTYRDPRAALLAEAGNKDEEKKPKKAWQVRDIAVRPL